MMPLLWVFAPNPTIREDTVATWVDEQLLNDAFDEGLALLEQARAFVAAGNATLSPPEATPLDRVRPGPRHVARDQLGDVLHGASAALPRRRRRTDGPRRDAARGASPACRGKREPPRRLHTASAYPAIGKPHHQGPHAFCPARANTGAFRYHKRRRGI